MKWERQDKGQRGKKKKEDGNQTGNKGGADNASRKPGANPDNSQISGVEKPEEEVPFAFAVNPKAEFSLNSKYGIPIQFRASSATEGIIEETWIGYATVGADRSGKPKPVFTTTVTANFMNPKLELEPKKLTFTYVWRKGVPSAVMKEKLKIKNTGHLPTTIFLKVEAPFRGNTEKLSLAPDEPEYVEIEFDPGAWPGRVSDKMECKLLISHDSHPHKDTVPLFGEVCFPNL